MAANDQALIQNVALVVATVVVVALAWSVIGFMRREAKGQHRADQDLLAEFQEAYEAGEMDSGEFRRVCESLQRQKSQPKPVPKPNPIGLEETLADPYLDQPVQPPSTATEESIDVPKSP